MHVPRLAGPALGVKGAILTFHEIHESAEAELWTGCEAKFLEASIRWFRNSGWDIVTLDEALRRLRDAARTIDGTQHHLRKLKSSAF